MGHHGQMFVAPPWIVGRAGAARPYLDTPRAVFSPRSLLSYTVVSVDSTLPVVRG